MTGPSPSFADFRFATRTRHLDFIVCERRAGCCTVAGNEPGFSPGLEGASGGRVVVSAERPRFSNTWWLMRACWRSRRALPTCMRGARARHSTLPPPFTAAIKASALRARAPFFCLLSAARPGRFKDYSCETDRPTSCCAASVRSDLPKAGGSSSLTFFIF